MGLSTAARQQQIIAEVTSKSHVTVKDLAADMDVSPATVRRDLKALAQLHQITLVHGGATLPRHGDYSFQAKQSRQGDAKRIIAKLAADLIQDNDQVFLDSGTTCFEMVPYLRGKQNVLVIANSTRITAELSRPGDQVILLGGQYRADRMDTVGPIATSTLSQLRGFQAFLGADGVSMDFGPAAADVDSAALYRLAVQNSREVTLLVDRSKFASASLFQIVPWDKISRVITDTMPDEPWRSFLDRQQIELLLPPLAEEAEQAPRQ